MRKLMCRLTLFPIMIIVSPVIYFVSWCLVGHRESMDDLKEILSGAWNTIKE